MTVGDVRMALVEMANTITKEHQEEIKYMLKVREDEEKSTGDIPHESFQMDLDWTYPYFRIDASKVIDIIQEEPNASNNRRLRSAEDE